MAIIGALTLDNGIAIYTVDTNPTVGDFDSVEGSIAILQGSHNIFIKGSGGSSDWIELALITDVASSVSDTVYGVSWDGVTNVAPSKNSIYDKIENVITNYQSYADAKISDTAYSVSWDGVTNVAPSKNSVYDKIETLTNKSTTLTINGTTYDLSLNRSWSVGTVTSILFTAAGSIFTVTGSPITSSGTIDLSLNNQAANTVFVSTDGISGVPSFRLLLNSDLPSAFTGKTYNNLTLTSLSTGFSIAGGTTSRTLTITGNATITGNNISQWTNDSNYILNNGSTAATTGNILVGSGLGFQWSANSSFVGADTYIQSNITDGGTYLSTFNQNSSSLSLTSNAPSQIAQLNIVAGSSFGVGVKSSLYYAYFRTDTLTADTVLQLPATSGTVALLSDITTSLGAYLPLTGGTLTGNLNGVTPTEISYISGTTSNLQNQINAINSGLSWKVAARVLSSANVNITSPGFNIDGVALNSGDRVVLNAQTTGSQNGVYVYNSDSTPMTRTTDASTGGSGSTGVLGMAIVIEEGTKADQMFFCTNDAPIVIGTTTLVFAKTSATTYTNGTGILLTGNVFSFDFTVLSATGALAYNPYTGVISMPVASSLQSGYLSNTDYVSFSGKQNALTLGNLTETTSSILSITGGTNAIIGSGLTIAVTKADATNSGYLASADFITFSGKGTFTLPALTAGSVLFSNGTTIVQDNSNFYYASALLSVKTGGDFSGTDAINVYKQIDSYTANTTDNGFTASHSRGTGTSPTESLANDYIGPFAYFAYNGSAWVENASMRSYVEGTTSTNRGARIEIWTKADGGALAKALYVDSTQTVYHVNTTSAPSYIATGTSGVSGYMRLVSGTVPTAVNGSLIIYSDSSSRLSLVKRNNANTVDITRTLVFPDSNITVTFATPATGGADTVAYIGTAQTYTATNIFNATQNINQVNILNNDGLGTNYFNALYSSSTGNLQVGSGFTSATIKGWNIAATTISAPSNASISGGGTLTITGAAVGSGAGNKVFISSGNINGGSSNILSVNIDSGTNGGTSGIRGGIALFNGSSEPTWNSLQRGMFWGNATAVPVSNPTGGGYMYVSSGNLFYWSSGNTTGTDATVVIAGSASTFSATNTFSVTQKFSSAGFTINDTSNDQTAMDSTGANALRIGNTFATLTVHPYTTFSNSAGASSNTSILSFSKITGVSGGGLNIAPPSNNTSDFILGGNFSGSSYINTISSSVRTNNTIITSSDNTGSGLAGDILICPGIATTTSLAGSRLVLFTRSSPSGTGYGYLTMFMGDRNTAPSGDPTGGTLLFSEGGHFRVRENGMGSNNYVVNAANATKVTASAPYTNDGYVIINIGGSPIKVMTTT